MYKKILLIIPLLFLACTTKYILVHGVPKSPTFTVIPMSFKEADISFANAITEALIANGIRVVERPVMLSKNIQSEKSEGLGGIIWTPGAGLGVGGGSSKGNEDIKEFIDPVQIIDVTDADYIVFVQDRNSWVKIVQRSTKQVVFVGTISTSTDESLIDTFKKLFKTMGIIE